MKKLLAVFLSVILMLSVMYPSFSVLAAAIPEQDDKTLEEFTEDVLALMYNNGSVFSIRSESYRKRALAEARVIVKSAKKIDTLNAVKTVEGYNDLHILQFKDKESADEALAYYESLDYVEYAQKDCISSIDAYETDTGSVDAVASPIVDKSEAVGINALKSYLSSNNIKYDDEIVVAILDTGIESTHELLEGRVIPNDFNSVGGDSAEDDEGHGTHVAGIVAVNSIDNVKLKPYKVADSEGDCADLAVMLGIEAAIEDGVDVINMSLGRLGRCDLWYDSVKKAYDHNIPVVVSAGNKSLDLSRYYYSPASFEECITVMACNADMRMRADFSNYGGNTDIAAPGVTINSSSLGNTYVNLSGTSMSCPFVTAAVTYMLLNNPNVTCDQIEAKIKNCAIPFLYYAPDMNSSVLAAGDVGLLYAEYLTRDIRKASSPVFGTEIGEFSETFNLTLSSDVQDGTVYYRTSLMTGTAYSKYTGPINIKYDTTVTAFTAKKGLITSDPKSVTYTRVYPTEDSKYIINAKGEITEYIGKDTQVVVPETVNGITVKGIGSSAFRKSNITSIILPETTEYISSGAFDGCLALEYVRMNSVTKAAGAFMGCTNLKNVECRSLETIGDSCFKNCKNLQDFDFSNVKVIEANAFENAGVFYSVVSDSITEIKSNAFRGASIVVVDLPNVTKIDGSAFYNCRSLESVNLPSITTLKDKIFFNCVSLKDFTADHLVCASVSVFSGCKALESLILPNLQTTENTLGSAGYVFSNCTSLTEFEAPKLADLSSGCFSGCSALESIYLPSVTDAGNFAFQNCTALKEIDLPKLASVNLNIFFGCSSLRELELTGLTETVANGNQQGVASIDFFILNKAVTIHSFPNDSVVLLPSTVKEIDATIPDNITIYASKGTYAYNWAVNNSVPVKEINQETALIKDVPFAFSPENSILSADIVGFNRTYQWCGTNVADNTTGNPISGATQKTFDTANGGGYNFYYCIVVSMDKGKAPVIMRTGVSADSTKIADFSDVRAAIAEIPEDLSIYTDETVGNLQTILDSIDYSTSIENQETVDGYAAGIRQAIKNLAYKPADYTEYNKAVARANALDRNHYASNELTDLDNALKVNVSGKLITEQAKVDDQTKKINNAVDALLIGYADYTEYNKVKDEANALNKNLYKDTSALTAALNVDVSKKLASQQHIVDAQTQKIRDAIDALEYKEANYIYYNGAVSRANAVQRYLYVDLTELDEALAVDVRNKLIIEQDIVDAQTAAINDAIDALVYKPADFTEYNKAVERAMALDRNSDYDFTELDEALAVDVSECDIIDQDFVNEQTQAILSAIENLGYTRADYTEYNKAVAKANSLDRSLYKDLTALDNALAVDVSGKDIYEQEIVDKQAQAILDAINALEYKPADYTNYNQAVEMANALDRSIYVDLTDLDEALAVDVSGKLKDEQSVVDAQTKAIRDAVAALRYKPADYTAYNKAVAKANSIDRSLYKSLTALDKALAVDVSYCNLNEQSIVDKQTNAILTAIDALEYKDADYTEYNSLLRDIQRHLDRDIYIDLTALDELIAMDISGKNITEQHIVDAHVQAIRDARSALEMKPADFSYYYEAVEAANALDRSLYEDLTKLDEALAIDVSGATITQQYLVDTAEDAILTAIEELQYKPADFSEYVKAVSKANALNRELYIDMKALDALLAVDISDKDITEQAEIDAHTKAINDAIDALEYKHADYSEYVKAFMQANRIDRSLYINPEVLDNAVYEDVSGKNITEQAIVDAQTKAILDAIDALEYKPADYSEYNKAVEEAKALNLSYYDNTAALIEALSVDVSGKNITEQAIVDKQTKAILDAIAVLEIKPADYYEYVMAIMKANKVNRSLYKDTTTLDGLLMEDVGGMNISQQAMLDAHTKAIHEAISNLEYKDADYSALEQAKAEIPENLSEYTQDSVDALNAVLNSIDYSLNITEQSAVDLKTQELIDAINALKSIYVDGDADFDGVIDTKDYEILRDFICGAGELDEGQQRVLDLDKDGTVDGIDLYLLDLFINTGRKVF